MDFDDPVEPITPVGVAPVDAADTAPRVAPVPRPASAAAARAPGELSLSDDLVEAGLDSPVAAPRSVNVRSAVHDAALHGERYAQAIERSDRAQQLGGAMAVASSGQATPPPNSPDVEDEVDDAVDPMAPIARVEAESHRRDNRHREERDNDDDLHS